MQHRGAKSTDAWTKSGVHAFNKISEVCNAHMDTDEHTTNATMLQVLLSGIRDPSVRIDAHTNRAHAAALDKLNREKKYNRRVLHRLFHIVRTLGKMGIAFRGDDESSDSSSRGNFLEIVHLVGDYDSDMKKWLENRRGNCSWMSKDIQNEMIRILRDKINLRLSDMVESAICFSIALDETLDYGKLEQVSLIIRFVYESVIHEHLVTVNKTSDATGIGLATFVENYLAKYDIDIKKLIAQCYDGASAMQGQYNGLAALLRQKFSDKIITMWCANHRLNLVIEDACRHIRLCIRVFSTLSGLHSFFARSGKRNDALKKVYEKFPDREKRLQSLAQTRWSARSTNINVVLDDYAIIRRTLIEISTMDKDAIPLLEAMQDFRFVMGLFILKPIFACINHASKVLQSRDFDLVEAAILIENLKVEIRKFAEKEWFTSRWASLVGFCDTHDVEMPTTLPRRQTLPAHFQNFDMSSSSRQSGSSANLPTPIANPSPSPSTTSTAGAPAATATRSSSRRTNRPSHLEGYVIEGIRTHTTPSPSSLSVPPANGTGSSQANGTPNAIIPISDQLLNHYYLSFFMVFISQVKRILDERFHDEGNNVLKGFQALISLDCEDDAIPGHTENITYISNHFSEILGRTHGGAVDAWTMLRTNKEFIEMAKKESSESKAKQRPGARGQARRSPSAIISLRGCLKVFKKNPGLINTYKPFYDLLCIGCTLPITSAGCERVFSTLKYVKNRLRASMHDSRSSDMVMLAVEKDLLCEIDLDECVEKFAERDRNAPL